MISIWQDTGWQLIYVAGLFIHDALKYIYKKKKWKDEKKELIIDEVDTIPKNFNFQSDMLKYYRKLIPPYHAITTINRSLSVEIESVFHKKADDYLENIVDCLSELENNYSNDIDISLSVR